MCWLCKASSVVEDLFWTDMNPTAGWRNALWTHEAYLEHLQAKGSDPPALFETIGLRVEHIMPDILHAIDLGITGHILGNIFHECLPKFGKKQSQQLANLQLEIKSWYKAHKVRSQLQGKLTLDRIRTTASWPKLKGKAAALRNLAPFGAELARKFNSGSMHDEKRLAVANDLNTFYSTLMNEGRLLSEGALKELYRIGNALPQAYAHLSAEALANDVRAWKIVPKFHLFQHLCLHQSFTCGNPRFYWTYADEDMVGHMVEVAQNCHPTTMAATGLFKWLVLHFE